MNETYNIFDFMFNLAGLFSNPKKEKNWMLYNYYNSNNKKYTIVLNFSHIGDLIQDNVSSELFIELQIMDVRMLFNKSQGYSCKRWIQDRNYSN